MLGGWRRNNADHLQKETLRPAILSRLLQDVHVHGVPGEDGEVLAPTLWRLCRPCCQEEQR